MWQQIQNYQGGINSEQDKETKVVLLCMQKTVYNRDEPQRQSNNNEQFRRNSGGRTKRLTINSIPYDPKIDIALDSLQTFTSCFEALKDEYHNNHNADDYKLLTAMETQAAVNKAMLDFIEIILAPTYPRAKHY